jgi:hypothetical protein
MHQSLRLRFNQNYNADHHSTLIGNLEKAERDHYHYRHGSKTEIKYFNISKFNFESQSFEGHLVGPDPDWRKGNQIIDIKYRVTTTATGNPLIHVDSTDRVTSYEQSLQLIEHALVRMSKVSSDLFVDHPFDSSKLHGPYLFSARSRARHENFENVCAMMERKLYIPKSFKKSLIDYSYDLQWRGKII